MFHFCVLFFVVCLLGTSLRVNVKHVLTFLSTVESHIVVWETTLEHHTHYKIYNTQKKETNR